MIAFIKNERAFLYRVSRNIVIDQSQKDKNKKFIAYEEDHCFWLLSNKVFPYVVTQLPEARLGIYISHSETHKIWFLETDIEIGYPPHALWNLL